MARYRRAVSTAAALAALAVVSVVQLPPGRAAAPVPPAPCPEPPATEVVGGRLPDIQTVVPQHLNFVNEHKREVLRFTNLIANTGDGPWRLRPDFPLAGSDPATPQRAFQQVLDSRDSGGAVVCERLASEFTYHPTHRHWHSTGVALFEVRVGAPDGPLFVNERGDPTQVKTTFCLIDWVKLIGPSNSGKNTARTYFDCAGPYHGVSVDWADQYRHSVDDQDLDITGVKAGVPYFLVSTTNAGANFLEKDYTNNAAWQAFTVTRDSQGNPKIVLGAPSPCTPGTGLCGEQTANR
jgi:hypothetical protein